tara:strand:- start:1144 stop:1365 length:222 start_codon:yes stop_codon:yes gene_type:complete
MGGMFSSPKPPAPPPLPAPTPPPPQKSDSDIRSSRDNERKRRLAAAGRKSTILTSGQGVIGDYESKKTTLLGS